MSEVMASLVNSGATQQAQQKSQLSPGQNASGETVDESGFPSLFHEVMSDARGESSTDAGTPPLDMTASAMLPLQPFTVNGVTVTDGELNLPTVVDPDAQTLPLDNLAEGKSLPFMPGQVALSGYVAYADNNGAAAKSFQGNGDQLVQSPVVVDADLNASLQRSQQQLKEFLATQPNALSLNADAVPGEQVSDFMEQLLVAGKERPVAEAGALQQTNPSNVTPLTNLLATGSGSDVLNQALSGARGGDAIQVPPQHPQWGQQVSDRLHWMIGQGLQQADIRLNPPELGSLEIRIKVQGDQASVHFTSPHGVVRDAIDAAMPRLREMLEHSGLNLADVNVSSQSAGQQGEHARHMAGDGTGAQTNAESVGTDEVLSVAPTLTKSGLGMLDVYA